MTDASYYRDLMRPVFAGRKIVIAVDTLQAAGQLVPLLADVGAARPFVLAGTIGTGPVAFDQDAEIKVIDTAHHDNIMDNIRAFETALGDLSADARAALDAYDPEGEAIVLGTLFTPDMHVHGRSVYGGRPRSWEALEDKTVIDALFDEAGVARAPSAVVPVADAQAASAPLDRGSGTAWAGDATEGWWGGAEYLRWVRTADDAHAAVSFFTAHCARVRVMPFLEGIPCSIHGMVFDDDVIAFRPVEMLTLKRAGSNRLLYAGLATYWDPPDADREAMRAIARTVGSTLRRRVDYRGVFTVDGVITEDGFLPTELNARPGAGISPQSAAAGVPIGVINKMLMERVDADWRTADLENLMVTAADSKRAGACYTTLTAKRTATETFGIAKRDGVFEVLAEGEPGDGTLIFGPSGVGGFVRYEPDAAKLTPGASFAPVAVDVFAFTDEHFDTGLGPLEAARSVR